MKVVHIIKRIEMVDQDIKDLRKLEKSLTKNKSFTSPIYMSIEKQINILLGERIKLLELNIANPPKSLLEEVKEAPVEQDLNRTVKPSREKAKIKKPKVKKTATLEEEQDDITILTQSIIDEKIKKIEEAKEAETKIEKDIRKINSEEDLTSDENIKLLDVALEKGTLNKTEIDKEKRKVRFFKDNFPGR